MIPGQGRIAKRIFSTAERAALVDDFSETREMTFDIDMNGGTFWRSVPEAVWN